MGSAFSTSATDNRVASNRHTAVVIGIFLAMAAAGMLLRAGSGASVSPNGDAPARLPVYASLILLEWLLVFVVVRGIAPAGFTVRDIIGARCRNWRDVARDVVIAAAIWGLWSGIAYAWGLWQPAPVSARVDSMLPRSAAEIAVWFVLSCSAGFAEELFCRGYLQRQLAAITGSTIVALVGQAVLFGVAHSYQGSAAVIRIVVYGLLFGIVAAWRRSLRPGMIAHAWTDIAAGFFRI